MILEEVNLVMRPLTWVKYGYTYMCTYEHMLLRACTSALLLCFCFVCLFARAGCSRPVAPVRLPPVRGMACDKRVMVSDLTRHHA